MSSDIMPMGFLIIANVWFASIPELKYTRWFLTIANTVMVCIMLYVRNP